MKCPYCEKEMQPGVMSGDGRSKVYWEPVNMKLGFMDKLVGKGQVDAEYSLTKFSIKTEYCASCKKMIFDTGIAK